MLIVFMGLPAVGKTTIARALAARIGAVYVRIDSIEQALRNSGEVPEVCVSGYVAAYAIAKDNLRNGLTVVADAVNGIELVRDVWRQTAAKAGSEVLFVEVMCTSKSEHRQRAESRAADLDGHILPTWSEIESREYEPGPAGSICVDTAIQSADEAVSYLADQLRQEPESSPV